MFPGYISINHLWSKFESGQGGAGYCLVCLLSSIINIYILEPTTSTPPIIPITPIIIATSTALIICSKLWLGFVLNCSLPSVRHLKYYSLINGPYSLVGFFPCLICNLFLSNDYQSKETLDPLKAINYCKHIKKGYCHCLISKHSRSIHSK